MGKPSARLFVRNLWAATKFYSRFLGSSGGSAVTGVFDFLARILGWVLFALILLGLTAGEWWDVVTNQTAPAWWVSLIRWVVVAAAGASLLWRNFRDHQSVLGKAHVFREQRDKALTANGRLVNELRGRAADAQRALELALAAVDGSRCGFAPFTARDVFLSKYQSIQPPFFSVREVGQWGAYGLSSGAAHFLKRMRDARLVRVIEPTPHPTDNYLWNGIPFVDRYFVAWEESAELAGQFLIAQEDAELRGYLDELRATTVTLGRTTGAAIDLAWPLYRALNMILPSHLEQLRERFEDPTITCEQVFALLPLFQRTHFVDVVTFGDGDTVIRPHYLHGDDLYQRINAERETASHERFVAWAFGHSPPADSQASGSGARAP